MQFPFIFIFSSFLALSTMFILSSSNWLLIWAALELNLLSLVPLLNSSSSLQETESSIKYFLAQAVGSSMMIMCILVIYHQSFLFCNSMMNYYYFIPVILVFSMILKLGAAPFHFWFPSVIAGANWFMALIISTWQKISPLYILTSMNFSSSMKMIIFSSAISALIGGVMGLNQSQLRPLMAYSSIGHMGWILCALIFSPSILFTYFIMYFILSIPIFLLLSKMNMNSILFMTSKKSWTMALAFMVLILSLAGLPPLLGFMPKWIIFFSLIKHMNMFLLMTLIAGTLINIFFYLSIFISSLYSLFYFQYQPSPAFSSRLPKLFTPMMTFSISLFPFVMINFLYALTILN